MAIYFNSNDDLCKFCWKSLIGEDVQQQWLQTNFMVWGDCRKLLLKWLMQLKGCPEVKLILQMLHIAFLETPLPMVNTLMWTRLSRWGYGNSAIFSYFAMYENRLKWGPFNGTSNTSYMYWPPHQLIATRYRLHGPSIPMLFAHCTMYTNLAWI